MTKVIAATTIGYHRPEWMSPVAATMAKAVGGRKPPNQPVEIVPLENGTDGRSARLLPWSNEHTSGL